MESLIAVRQLPIIEEQLRTLKDRWEQRALDAEAMVCTADTIQSVKTFRAEMRKEFYEVEAQRKAVKKAIMEPYDQFEAIYKDCVTDSFHKADRACALKACSVEDDMRKRCEDGLRDYFAELCAVHHLDWLAYERAGIKVDMASAKAKTPKKLREQLASFVAGVAQGVDRISSLDDAEEIMVEFQRSLDAADAICAVQERHRRIEEQKSEQEARRAAQEQEAAMVQRVEALAPPVAVPAPAPEKSLDDIIPVCSFTVYDTPRRVLRQIKEILNMEGIRYE